MRASKRGQDIHGILLLDKPAGISSNQAVQKVKRLLQARKAGHTGSLDPFATGMLPICLGEASKTAGFMLDASKSYLATARLGQATATGDTEGEVVAESPAPELSHEEIETVFRSFTGTIEQVPPMYSALKHQGQPLYKLARDGKQVERKPRAIVIHRIDLVSVEGPLLTFQVHCSKGTYVRTLAEDLAAAMGTCAHLQALRRLAAEPFDEADMMGLERLEEACEAGRSTDLVLPVDAGLAAWPVIRIDDPAAGRFVDGNPVRAEAPNEGMARVYSQSGRLLGLGEILADGQVQPKRVFVGL